MVHFHNYAGLFIQCVLPLTLEIELSGLCLFITKLSIPHHGTMSWHDAAGPEDALAFLGDLDLGHLGVTLMPCHPIGQQHSPTILQYPGKSHSTPQPQEGKLLITGEGFVFWGFFFFFH